MSKLVRAGESYLFNYKTTELELCLQEMVEVKKMIQFSDVMAYPKTMCEIKGEKIGTENLQFYLKSTLKGLNLAQI